MIRRLTTALWAALACFHVYLLACQVVDGRLLDGGLLIRWGLGFGIASVLFGLHRAGASLWGRQAVAPWLLVTLLHGPAVLDRGVAPSPAIQPAAISLTAVLLSAAVGLVLLAAATLSRRRVRPLAVWSLRPAVQGTASLRGGFGLVLSARPPPLA